MVPVEKMCEAKPAASDTAEEGGITEQMDKILAEKTSRKRVRTWEEIWRLLFPRDTAVLDPGKFISPINNLSPKPLCDLEC